MGRHLGRTRVVTIPLASVGQANSGRACDGTPGLFLGERAEDGSMQGQTCVICSALFQEFGHDAKPVKRGRCCNLCNDAVVIPERIRLMRLQDETVRKVQRDREPS
jgi:hypothetical protein